MLNQCNHWNCYSLLRYVCLESTEVIKKNGLVQFCIKRLSEIKI